MSSDLSPKPHAYFKWWVCFLLLLASTLNYMDRQALSQTGVRITDYFQLSNKQFGRLESVFNLGFAVGVLGIGWLVDRGNIRIIYPTIVVLWSVAGFASGYAPTYAFLLVCRLALGLFEAGNIPCGVLTVKRVLKPEERALGNGMFQSGTAFGAILTPFVVFLCLRVLDQLGSDDTAFRWQLPFRVVGAVGLLWAAAWLFTVKSHHVHAPPSTTPVEPGDTYWAIFRNRRFWVALIVVMSINAPWRSFGFWLPKLLQSEKGYTEDETLFITPGFFVAADIGTLSVGAVILWLARRGMPLPKARLLCFLFCGLLTTLSILTALFPRGPFLIVMIYFLGFGALGLFPIYYALSQEISSKHQGKVTGTLSCLNALYLSGLFYFQGVYIDRLGSYALALGVVGLFPLLGVIAMALGWRDPKKQPTS